MGARSLRHRSAQPGCDGSEGEEGGEASGIDAPEDEARPQAAGARIVEAQN
jgi:hypothetical protein